MATAFPVDDLFECPVCYEPYTDPRSLSCAHQFCLSCLERIVQLNASLQGQICCPECKHETSIPAGKWVTDLPRPVLMNKLQEALKSPSQSRSQELCQLCEVVGRQAVSFCHSCQKRICLSCKTDHQEMELFRGHDTEDIADSLLCSAHGEIAKAFCIPCKICVCAKCVITEHRQHKAEDIYSITSQQTPKGIAQTQPLQSTITDKLAPAKTKLHELKNTKNDTGNQIDRIINSLKLLESKLEHTYLEMQANTTVDVEGIELYEAEFAVMDESRSSLKEYGLQGAGLDGRQLAAAFTTRDRRPTDIIPADPKLDKLEKEVTKWIEMSEANSQTDIPCESRITNADCQETIEDLAFKRDVFVGKHRSPWSTLKRQILRTAQAPVMLFDVVFISEYAQLVVRTNDKRGPIKVYDMAGSLIRQLGKQIQGLCGLGCLAFDPQRDLFLAPCGDHLTTIDMEGRVREVIQVKGSHLHGVTCHKTAQLYIVTDINNDRVVIVDANSREVVLSFGSYGSGNARFDCPFHVTVSEVGEAATIMVSDHSNHAIKLFDLSGAPVRSYGREGHGPGELDSPQGVASDRAGWHMVCDSGNQRVVTYSSDGDEVLCQCLLSEDQLEGEPVAIDVDPLHKQVAVIVMSGKHTLKLFSYK